MLEIPLQMYYNGVQYGGTSLYPYAENIPQIYSQYVSRP